ncbi:Tetratricopeptide repeat (TPR)-like superfamily protein [Striga hermonthica]|uniref:Tetratricopeptide repeat (TPR)-like superfamily protein n=1 Tax=Striga hermonthica TaxID=68872 RepID=A0A9N7RJA6_STRHE|nr:Tetratricopeptide repeat (TPR)-like superfamily protein [Striga hermonthica]
MNRSMILRVLRFLLLVLLLNPKPTAQKKWPRGPRPAPPVSIPPLCDAQYGLVNSACGSLPAGGPWAPPGPLAQNSTGEEEKCCRWLKEVDDTCVCGLLVPLPAFMSRPAHNYTVVVEGVCEVTFRCGSRLVGP